MTGKYAEVFDLCTLSYGVLLLTIFFFASFCFPFMNVNIGLSGENAKARLIILKLTVVVVGLQKVVQEGGCDSAAVRSSCYRMLWFGRGSFYLV